MDNKISLKINNLSMLVPVSRIEVLIRELEERSLESAWLCFDSSVYCFAGKKKPIAQGRAWKRSPRSRGDWLMVHYMGSAHPLWKEAICEISITELKNLIK